MVAGTRALGADHVVDYTREDFADGTHTYDLILDLAGNCTLSRLREALRPSGTLVIVGGEERRQMDRRVRSITAGSTLLSDATLDGIVQALLTAGAILLATRGVVSGVVPVGRSDLKVERRFRPPIGACLRRAGDLKVGGKWADLAADRVSQCQTVKSYVWRLRRSSVRNVKQCQATTGAQCTTGVSQRSQVQILPPLLITGP